MRLAPLTSRSSPDSSSRSRKIEPIRGLPTPASLPRRVEVVENPETGEFTVRLDEFERTYPLAWQAHALAGTVIDPRIILPWSRC